MILMQSHRYGLPRRHLAFGCLIIMLGPACQPSTEEIRSDADAPPKAPEPAVTLPPRTTPQWVNPKITVAGTSVEGRPIKCVTFGDDPSDCVLIMATIHGDEDAGTPLVNYLSSFLIDNPQFMEGRQIVLMPVVNPDGYANQTRTNARGVDLNRNFPAANFRGNDLHGRTVLSEPESKTIFSVLREYHPNRIVSIHQMLRSGSCCIDHDGPAERLAVLMAKYCDIPVRRLGGRPGSLGSYAGGTLQTPIITFELPKGAKGQKAEALWDLYGEALLAAITFPMHPPAIQWDAAQ